MSETVVHVIAPYQGNSPLFQRQELFLESVEQADRKHVALLAGTDGTWRRDGWLTRSLARHAGVIGDRSEKPFIKDLFDLALETAQPGDWILYTNTDCAVDPNLYQVLRSVRGTVVEYMRQDVSGDPKTLEELFSNPRKPYSIGLDGFAMRAQLYSEIRDQLPDFVVGEPHWDTIFSGVLRRIVPVRRTRDLLYHPEHDQAWSLGNPTPAGDHNHQLFVDALTYGDAEKSLIQDEPETTDTAIILASFGDDQSRIKANVAAMTEQFKQDLYCDFYLVEMLSADGESAYPADILSAVNHVPVRSAQASVDLFQKESLMNIGWRTALQKGHYDYFIFVDADVYSHERDWFRKIRARLHQNPSAAVQGFRIVRDTKDPNIHYSSLASAYVLNHQTDLPLNPGLCWALHREVLEAGNGFNADCIECAGDSAFVSEYLNWDSFQYDPWLNQFNWFHEIVRDLPFRAEMDCVPVDVVHAHHGYLRDRNYDAVRYAIDGFPSIRQLVGRDSNGLLFWKDADCRERQILEQRQEMHSRADVDRLFNDFNYPRVERKEKFDDSDRRKVKPVVDVSSDETLARVDRGSRRNGSSPADPNVLTVFDPVEVFRSDFPFSWCDGVKRAKKGSTYIPISNGADAPTLKLEADGSLPYVVGCLPIQPSWEPFDLTRFSSLNFRVFVSDPDASDVRVQLTSQETDGSEQESPVVSLQARGLRIGALNEFSIPLSEFAATDEFPLERTRLVKFVAGEGASLSLGMIRIT